MTFVKDIHIGTRKALSSEEKKKASNLIEKERVENAKPVTGVFKNLEAPSGDLEFVYREFKGDPLRSYYFKDGETYTIPLGVAKHINKQCKYKRSKYLLDKNGVPAISSDKPIQRYQFVSTDFM